MNGNESGLRCYRCLTPGEDSQSECAQCGLPLRWNVIHELNALDYTRAWLDLWKRQEKLSPGVERQLVDELGWRHRHLLESLRAGERPQAPEPPTAPAAPIHTTPEPHPIEVDVPAAPVPVELARGAQPSAEHRPFVPPVTAQAPPPVVFERPPMRPRVDAAPPPPPPPPRRPVLEVLLDVATLRLMLYVGAVLLAVGVIIYLRDVLRTQLQRPEVQAGLLVLATAAILGTGIYLVRRAGESFERKLLGRGFLLLGSLLVPVNPWFFARAGLVEDRGNAWVVTLACFLLYTGIAVGLGERVFVFLSYAAALLTGWLLTFKVTGGASPGAYALSLVAISLVYLHLEYVADRTLQGRSWERFARPLLICGHVGIAAALIFYTEVTPFVPPELLAAFRYFDGSGYSPWVGTLVAALAAEAYLYTAKRIANPLVTYAAIWAALWCVAMWLRAADASADAWLLACGACALVLHLAARALAADEIWGPPLLPASRVLAWVGFLATLFPAAALAGDFAEVRWQAAAGAALVAATFAIDAFSEDSAAQSLPLPLLALFVVAWLLDLTPLDRIHQHEILALIVALIPPAGASLLAGRPGVRLGTHVGSGALALLGVVAATGWTIVEGGAGTPGRAIPVVVLAAVALGVHGWYAQTAPARYAFYGLAAPGLQLAFFLAAFALYPRLGLAERYAAFLLLPLPYSFLGAWLLLKRSTSERVAEVARVVRAGAALGGALVALFCLPLVVGAVERTERSLFWISAYALLAVVPLAFAAVRRDGFVAYVEGHAGVLLALASYAGVIHAAMVAFPERERSLVCAGLGLAPLLLAGGQVLVGERARAVSRPAGWIADTIACTLTAGLFFASALPGDFGLAPEWDRGRVLLAALLAVHGLLRSLGGLRPAMAIQAAAACLLLAHQTLRAVDAVEIVALLIVVAAAVLLAAAGRFLRDDRAPVRAAAMFVAYGWCALALGHTAAAQTLGQPVTWWFVAVLAAVASAAAAGALASERDSWLDWGQRAAAALVGFAAASAALHALGRLTPGAQAEPLALLLVAGAAAATFSGSEWARRIGLPIAHVCMGILLVACAVEQTSPSAERFVWTSSLVARFAAEVAAFYAVASIRHHPASAYASLAAAAVSLLALGHFVDASWGVQVIVFAAVGVAVHGAGRRVPSGAWEWLRSPLEVGGQMYYWASLATASLRVLPDIVEGTFGLPNATLTAPVATFATLAAGAWVLRRGSESDAGAAAYAVAWRMLALASYCLLGLRAGMHPWHDSVFYTLPVAAVLVTLGVLAARRGDEGAAPLLWLGSLLAAAPMFLHALDNRFVSDVSPFAYDAGTMTTGLVLAAIGVLFQTKAPSLVGATVLFADLAIAVFGQIKWSGVPPAVYAIAVGGVLFGAAWLLLFRREQLMHLRDRLRARREKFAQWR